MPDVITCPNCQANTPDKFNFCLQCKRQTKCLNKECREILIADEPMCLYCGKVIEVNYARPQQNKFVHNVKQRGSSYEEHTVFLFSDHVATELAPFIGGQMPGRQPTRQILPTKQTGVTNQGIFGALIDSSSRQENIVTEQLAETPQTPPVNITPQGAERLFRRDGEILLAETKDYKGANWAEQQRRFILLYASAYEQLLGRAVVDKDHFKAVADKASILDKNNFGRYLTEVTKKYFLITSSGLSLNADGKQEVVNIVATLDDPQIPEGFPYWAKSQAEATKRHYLNDKDKERLQSWAKEEVTLGLLDPLTINNGRDYALLAYWLLITHLKKGGSFLWNEAYEYLKVKLAAVSASPEAFSRAVKSDSNKEYFRDSDGAYFLTPDAKCES